ncbi:sigma 54-interacting transcriptional regulator [Shewanella phaeophyticola]|uniref:Sigma 54-interacting transcriptional regulator n=1 Tax=Shewanella phaeophyticola TaxID=2978345 RepID=A0ABT2P8H7_9GAMM|nr:sigma 54-interacting transcriptional regulator [Shewanella sp. KJ10-1]MCT8987641.1 sigma 54-interacting transcriptional regulator [Shewanella sp. KJ10-1]
MIKVDEKEFFKEVVVRLTSSLNINKAIFSLSEYLRKYMKVIDFELYIPMEVSGQFRKIIYYSSGHSSDGTSWLPQNYWNWLKQQRTPFLLRDTDKNRFVDELTTIIELKGFSTLISPLLIEDKPIGYILIRVEGENEFPSSIISLMAVATKPFSIILANGIADNLIKQHRNLFVSDKQSVHNALSVNPKIEIVGENSGLKNVLEMVRKVAQKKTTVLLQGETGTGKEVIVSAIHHMSSTPNAAIHQTELRSDS